jgi:hypothetical protein
VASSSDCCLARAETHLPKALRWLALVPYFVANASASAFFSALQVYAALISAAVSALISLAVFALSLRCWETHLPIAFERLAFVP